MIPTFLKWAGGKSQLLPLYQNQFPQTFKRYFEPFLGSGAVYFYLRLRGKAERSILSDVNEDLVNAYRVVREQPQELLWELKKHENAHHEHGGKYYYEVRDGLPQWNTALQRAARLIYLNRTCYNGLYRVNSSGKFNVPIGRYKRPQVVREDVLSEASKLLADTELHIRPFEEVLDHARAEDFIYFDPPYYPLSKTASFTSYQKSVFGEREHRKLAEVFRELDRRGCYVMLSNSSAPFVLGLYKDYQKKGYLHFISARRAISSNPKTRGVVKEILVVNYKPQGTRYQSGLLSF